MSSGNTQSDKDRLMDHSPLASQPTDQRKRILFFSALIMASVATLVTAITIVVLYRTAFQQEKERLVVTAQSQARLIEAIARQELVRYGRDGLAAVAKATLTQLTDAHAHYEGFGRTGEFTLAKLQDEHIIFLLSHRHEDEFGTLEHHAPIPFTGRYAEPMRRALRGLSGTVVGLDYRGETVLAAYEPVGELNFGIVAKIDLKEIREPFVRAGAVTAGVALLVILLGGGFMLRACDPLIARLETSEARTRSIVETAADAIITISDRGIVESYNAAAERMFGYPADEIIGGSVNILMPSPDREKHDRYLQRYLDTGEAHIIGTSREAFARRRDGTVFPVELAISEATVGEKRIFAGIVADITERKRIEEALRESEAHQTLVLGAVPMVLYVAHPPPAFKTTWASEQAQELSGYPADQFVREPDLWKRRLHPEDRERVFREFATLLKGDTLAVEYRWQCADGTYRWFLDQPTVVRDDLGKPRQMIGTWLDITERKRAERALRMTQFAFDHAGDAIFWVRPDGRFFAVNEAACRAVACSREQLLTMTVHDVDPNFPENIWREKWQEFRQSGFATIESCIRPRSGPIFPVEISVNYMEFDEREFICAFVRDITERKRAAEELQRAKEAAEAASRAKGTFLANMSHEIRTPITAMLGAAETLAVPDASGLSTQQQIDMVLRNGRHLLTLIDDILDVSRAEAGKLGVRCTRCDLLEIVADMKAVVQPFRRRPHVEFRVVYDTPIPTVITTDPTRLKQALINLVSNALKFTETGYVHMHLAVEKHPPSPRLTVVVEDTGVGIADGDKQRIFEVFAQGDPGFSDMPEGVGLGLPLCKRIAEELGGSLDLTSTAGRGSRFTLRVAIEWLDDVPWLSPAEARRRGDNLPGEAALEPATGLCGSILIAEDFRDTRLLIADALTRCGAAVTTVDNGRDAVKQAMNHSFDLILMDVRMPEMDGVSATKELRRRGCLVPIVALTAVHRSANRTHLLEAGFDDLWPKPISLDALVARAAAYLPARRAADDGVSVDRNNRNTGRRHRQVRFDRAVADFVDTLQERASCLQTAVHSQDMEQAREILHQLVGACGIHGFMSLSQETARLLERIQSGTLDDRSNDLEVFFGLVDQARSGVGENARDRA